MKNFLIASAILITSGVFAQKGSFYVGGQVGYSSSKTKIESTTTSEGSTWNFSPEVGTFLTNNVQLGVGFTTQGSTKESGNTEIKENQYGGTLYGRYFFGEGSKAFRPFVGLNIGLLPGNSTTTRKTILGNLESKNTTFELNTNLNAGFGYALSPKITVVGSLGVLGFSSHTSKNKETDVKEEKNTFNFDINSLGNRFNVGIYYTL
ncbi:hypothetical protein B0A78_07715 [Flavobacterium columnare NBRC 100251 = ATCC 23463]|uniref:Outer membrane protein beta-barrel domain-containing protein n=3 Tax=Flavobacterium columnare TaxID=996 RepID=G8XAA5_FLACA|nr:outer membrane beta-barrel protein [Flavobacterium columnare]AEW85963.1 hypothetical protein FCOL_05690 [Flavobacterium columnare ATCC 49512]AMO19806.1 porin family protein [Flavobacterium columnare]ANO48726.1 hypothetical protein Pf1_00478 [Flavobacterium columnare]APT23239.1 hypothetical protein BU993_11780 [Flavobacterium columnare]AUX17737.1 hypothetical protein AQ623_05175 [Flavobacterium columnare]